jgi:hypothetical protein
MKPIQQDDIFDSQNNKQKLKFYFNGKIVKAINRKDAVEKFKKNYNIDTTTEQVTNDKTKEIIL